MFKIINKIFKIIKNEFKIIKQFEIKKFILNIKHYQLLISINSKNNQLIVELINSKSN